MKKIYFLFTILFIGTRTYGQINMTTTGSYTQDFNTVVTSGSATWVDNSTIANWYAQRSGTGTTIVANDGSSNAGNFYSYGTGTNTDRALGSVGSGNAAIGNLARGVLLRNTSGTIITDITIAFAGEQWRNSAAAAQTVTFYYKTSSSIIIALTPANPAGWTPITALNFSSPVTGGAAGALNGNLAANRTVIPATAIPSLTLNDNDYIMLKWDDPDHAGSDHGLSIDDFTINWTAMLASVPAVTSFTPALGYTGTSVVITGTNFTGATSVTFGGTNAASFTVDNPTQVTAVAGEGATGVIGITTPGGTGSSAGSFTNDGYITTVAGDWNTGATWLGGNAPPQGADVTVAHDILLNAGATLNNLTFLNGKITLGINDLTVAGILTGGSSSNYVVTDGEGTLTINNVGASDIIFPVGPGGGLYHPVTINNIGTADNFSVKVTGSYPACAPPGMSVDAMWDISEAVAGESDCTIKLDFTGAITGASFTASTAQIVHCSGAVADYHNGSVTDGVATGIGFTGFSPFGITSDATVLPVQFANVKAYRQGNAIKINWSNLTEKDIVDYQVERSSDGRSFTYIGNQVAKLNNGSKADYSFLDALPLIGINYYRIYFAETGGGNNYSIVVKIDLRAQGNITIYPNPVSGKQASLQLSGLQKGLYHIGVFAANGQRVYNGVLLHTGGAATGMLRLPAIIKKGIYTLELTGTRLKVRETFIVR